MLINAQSLQNIVRELPLTSLSAHDQTHTLAWQFSLPGMPMSPYSNTTHHWSLAYFFNLPWGISPSDPECSLSLLNKKQVNKISFLALKLSLVTTSFHVSLLHVLFPCLPSPCLWLWTPLASTWIVVCLMATHHRTWHKIDIHWTLMG